MPDQIATIAKSLSASQASRTLGASPCTFNFSAGGYHVSKKIQNYFFSRHSRSIR